MGTGPKVAERSPRSPLMALLLLSLLGCERSESQPADRQCFQLPVQEGSEACSLELKSRCYGEIHPYQASFDVGSLIHISNKGDVERVRKNIIGYLWAEKGWPFDKMPIGIDRDIPRPSWVKSKNVKNIDRLNIEMDYGLRSTVYHLQPTRAINRLLLLHHGHTQYFGSHRMEDVTSDLLDQGFAVMAFQMPLLGDNSKQVIGVPSYGNITLKNHDHMSKILENSRGSFIRFFIEPVVVGINYAVKTYSYDDISMIGLSGGGWATHLSAALDPRIKTSVPVAGAAPLYLREGPCSRGSMGDAEQWWGALYKKIASWPDIYILGSYGEGRGQVEVLNQYDSCCFYGIGYRTYESIVSESVESLGSGFFRVYLDKSHCRHMISDVTTREVILPLLSSKVRPDLCDVPSSGGQ